MKKVLAIVILLITTMTSGLFNMNCYAKSTNDEDNMMTIYRIWKISIGSEYKYVYIPEVLPEELGNFVNQIDNEYDHMINGGVKKETIDKYQIMKYADKLIELNEKYPGWVNLEALGL